jgi:hydroxymethylbilane synthase
MSENIVRIGTRRSPLAMWQAEYVKGRLEEDNPGITVELVPIETRGDKILDVALSKVGGKGLFVKELEVALLENRVDLCVHSTKDMPAELPEGLGLLAFPPRADPRDAFVMGGHAGIQGLPHGARVGTSSLRRQAQLLSLRPDLEIVSVRGNIQTRMKKVAELGLECVVLACAGIERMADDDKIGHRLHPDEMLPAAGQGILAIEAREQDQRILELISRLDDPKTRRAVTAERRFLKVLGGGCQVPIGAYATEENGVLTLRGLVADPTGQLLIRAVVEGDPSKAEQIGQDLGQSVLGNGGRKILVQIGLGDSFALADSEGILAGRSIIVARDDAPDDPISLALQSRGAAVVGLPLMIFDEPADGAPFEAAIRHLSQFDVFAFTSTAAVERFVERMESAGVDLRQLRNEALVAAVGPATREALESHHVHVDVVGDGGGERLAEAIVASTDVQGKSVLFPRAEGGRRELADALESAGATVTVVDAYRSVIREDAVEKVSTTIDQASGGADPVIVMTSPRRVQVLKEALGASAKEKLARFQCVAIGDTTQKAAVELPFSSVTISAEPSALGIIDAVRKTS